jgi:peptide chain release factor 1
MNEFIIKKLEEKVKRFKEVKEELSNPEIIKNRDNYISLSKEEKELEKINALYQKYTKLMDNIDEDARILQNSSDPELISMARDEIESLKKEKELFEKEILSLVVPKNPDNERNAILEIRAGTGGDEASLFAKNLFKMYSRYSERRGWKIEPILAHSTEVGGFKEVISLLKGKNVYGRLRFESGVHRVQRVPVTESGGRIHTSTATVAVLPEATEIDVKLDEKDVKMNFFHSSGPGGQNVNKLSTAVRLTHIPTGIVVECQDERSQYKNRVKAMRVLLSRLYDRKRKKEEKEIQERRKSQVGTGERSEKIRTYNFREKRVTDHRINLTIYRLDEVLGGNLDLIIDKLLKAEIDNRLKPQNDTEFQ